MANRIALCAGAWLAAAVAVAVTTPARAQCRLCDVPTTAAPSIADTGRISLTLDATLDFDRLVLNGAGEGSATILPNGERRSSGSVAAISGSAMVGAVAIRGEAGRAVRIDLPSRIQLYTLAGGSIAIDEIVSDIGDDPRLDSAGNLSFRFGGRVTVSGDSDGDYRGDLPITVEYP